jgi:hypothetical protein
MLSRCIERGVSRVLSTMSLFDSPGIANALPVRRALMPVSATGRAFMVSFCRNGEGLAPATASKEVAVRPGQRVVTTTPLSGTCDADKQQKRLRCHGDSRPKIFSVGCAGRLGAAGAGPRCIASWDVPQLACYGTLC